MTELEDIIPYWIGLTILFQISLIGVAIWAIIKLVLHFL